MIKPLIVSFAGLLCTPAWSLNVCTDAAGRTSIQDQPCMSLAPTGQNGPVVARQVTPRVATDTVKRFVASISSRDAITASSFFVPSFTASIQTGDGRPEHFDRPSFVRLLHRELTAASRYEAAAQCRSPVAVPDGMEVTCELTERAVLVERATVGRTTEVYRVVLHDGTARIAGIRALRHE